MTGAALPTGTVTFLFTDIEGSTRLLQRLGPDYVGVQDAHDSSMRAAIAEFSGVEVRTQGDSFFVVFSSALDALLAAAAAQRRVVSHPLLSGVGLRVRMGLHTGIGTLGGDDYVGLDVHRAARIQSAGHGGQVLVSAATAALTEHSLPPDLSLRSLGDHSLKDLSHPEHLSQLVVAGLPSDFPTLRTLDAVPNNLPGNLTSFIGRAGELRQTRQLLASTRLLTFTGPGGVGKTRLALQVAAEMADRYPDGTFIVQLAPIRRAELVPSAILEALTAPTSAGLPPHDYLLEYVEQKSLLLLLDNFEQLLDAAPLVSDILQRSPATKVIATSRAALRVQGEQEVEVAPLAVPEDAAESPDTIASYESVALFAARAAAVRPTFALDAANAADVAELATRLDGLPLAIELAASWVKLLPPSAILDRLGERVLRGGRRDAAARQRTLHGTIEWSYDLLEEPYRRLFERFSVFTGGASLDQVESVSAPDDEIGVDVLDGLSMLVDHSLIRQFELLGEARFRMLTTIRDYAALRLTERGDAEDIATRHAGAYADLARSAAPHLTGSDRGLWLDRLAADHDNLRSALHFAIERGNADLAAEMVGAIWRFWQMRGLLYEGSKAVTQVLGMPGGTPRIRAGALEAAGGIAYWQGDMGRSRRCYEEALAILETAGSKRDIAFARYNLSYPFLFGGDVDRGVALLEQSLAAFEELGDAEGIAATKWGLGNAALTVGEPERAHQYITRSIRAFEQLDDPVGLGWAMYTLGEADVMLGNYDEAHLHLLRGVEIFADSDDLSALVMFLAGFTTVAAVTGREERAIRLAGALANMQELSGTDLVEVGFAVSYLLHELLDLDALPKRRPDLFEEGRRMTPHEVLAYIRADPAEPAR